MTKVSLVAAMGINGVIGKDGALPWRIPSELQHFRATTLGHVCIIGRVSYETLPTTLPGRDVIVLTRNPEYAEKYAAGDLPRNIYPAKNLDAALVLAKSLCALRPSARTMVIGGSGVYKAALPYAREIVLTVVHATPDGDRYFPAIDQYQWRTLSSRTFKPVGTDDYGYSVIVMRRGFGTG